MKVGVLQFFSWPERRVPLEQVYARALQRIEVMDRSGYDAVWLAEHHFTTYSVCPSVHLMALEAAHRTTNLRIGTAVSLAALYHPLRLAEEVALIDVLTGGRVNWGAGRGFELSEFANFGVPIDETAPRFREAVEVVLAAWTNERLTFHGKYWDFDDVEVLPKPVQQPHPPIHFGGESDAALRRVADVGQGWFGYALLPAAAAERIERLTEMLEQRGRRREDVFITVAPNVREVDEAMVEEYRRAGVDQLNVPARGRTAEAYLDSLRRLGETLIRPAATV